jgi:hypothetical protein
MVGHEVRHRVLGIMTFYLLFIGGLFIRGNNIVLFLKENGLLITRSDGFFVAQFGIGIPLFLEVQ